MGAPCRPSELFAKQTQIAQTEQLFEIGEESKKARFPLRGENRRSHLWRACLNFVPIGEEILALIWQESSQHVQRCNRVRLASPAVANASLSYLGVTKCFY